MAKTVALFNHKGGVSKTTTTFNLGWMLAELGSRVVIVDTDPQCNLTGLVLGYNGADDFDAFYAKNPDSNIWRALAPAFESQPKQIEAVPVIEVAARPGLSIVPGHVNLTEYEVTLGIAQELSGSIPALKNMPGAFRFFIDRIVEAYGADYVLIDMSPSLGSLNQNFLMSSDRFIVPAAPDYFSVMAIDSLASILPRWIEWGNRAAQSLVLQSSAYPFATPNLRFLGTVIQRFRPRKGSATQGFQAWIAQINQRVLQKLVPALDQHHTMLPIEDYIGVGNAIENPYCLAEIPDFNSMITISQEHQTPVFALTPEMFNQTGAVLDQSLADRDKFHMAFSALAQKVTGLS
jgi:cellulose biosynthesis protein BcsQ